MINDYGLSLILWPIDTFLENLITTSEIFQINQNALYILDDEHNTYVSSQNLKILF